MEIQELVSRGRLLFSDAPKRMEVFRLVNGRRSAKEISRKSGKPYVATLNDLLKMKDLELITPRRNKDGSIARKDDSIIYEKAPLIRHIPHGYFVDSTRIVKGAVETRKITGRTGARSVLSLRIPTENEILDICKNGEDQIYEFKTAGTDTRNLTREVAAFANTKLGGLIFYGIEDDGAIVGSDKRKQELDQPVQNSIRNTISPPLLIDIEEKDVLRRKIILIRVPAWNRKDVYHYEGRVYLRNGTNVFVATPSESKKLHRGIPVV